MAKSWRVPREGKVGIQDEGVTRLWGLVGGEGGDDDVSSEEDTLLLSTYVLVLCDELRSIQKLINILQHENTWNRIQSASHDLHYRT